MKDKSTIEQDEDDEELRGSIGDNSNSQNTSPLQNSSY